jgi:epoxyqueuosine reductase
VHPPVSEPGIPALDSAAIAELAQHIKREALALGFTSVGISGIDLAPDEAYFRDWLAQGFHGEMGYLSRWGAARAHPEQVVPGTVRVVSVRLDYWPSRAEPAQAVLDDRARAYVSRYAVGRDYHRLMRRRLQTLASRVRERIGPFGYRAFVDTGPVLEKALARNAGLGWIGKHTNLIDSRGGSWFFLGELYTDLPLPVDAPASDHCGSPRCSPRFARGRITSRHWCASTSPGHSSVTDGLARRPGRAASGLPPG